MTKILIIGEAYGRTEDEYQHGFTGSSGIELSFMLRDAGLTHNHQLFCQKCQIWGQFPKCNSCQESLYPSSQDMIRYWSEVKEKYSFEITNVFEIHPENNDLGSIFSPIKNSFMPGLKYNPKRPISYLLPQFQHHLEILWNRINESKPNLCLLLGNTATWAVLRQANISQIRGTITSSDYLNGTKCLATFHPANILRDWPNRIVALADFQKAHRESEFPEIRRIHRKVTLNADLDEIKNWLNLPADYYAVDIESGYALFTSAELQNITNKMRYNLSSQISMIGFARNPYDSLVIEFMTRNKPNLSYWNNSQDETQAWNYVKELLSRSIPKIFQNGIYDLTRMLYMGLHTNMATDDTMLLHHSLYPEMRKSLGFLGSIYANETAWKTIYGKGESLKKDE